MCWPPILQNTRFSNPCHAHAILGTDCIFCRSALHEYFPNDAKQNTVLAEITYGVLIALNIAAFTLLSYVIVFSTQTAVLEIIKSMQM